MVITKIDLIDVIDKRTGEIIEESTKSNIIEEVNKEAYNNLIKRVKWLFDNEPEKLTEDEIRVLRNLKKCENKIEITYKKDGYFTMKQDVDFYHNLNITTCGFILKICHMITHDCFIKYKNGVEIKTIKDLYTHLGIPERTFYRDINKQIKEYKLIKKSHDKSCLMINPLYAVKSRDVGRDTFLTFKEELREVLTDVDYYTLLGRYKV